MKKHLSINYSPQFCFLFILFVSSCSTTYTAPKAGRLASVEIESSSDYNDVKVEYCEDAECKNSERIGFLAGASFLDTWGNSEKILKEYKDRLNHKIVIAANIDSYIRFTTEKFKMEITKKPKKRSTVTESFGIVITKTWLDYVKNKQLIICYALVKVNLPENAKIKIIHTHDAFSDECNAITEIL